MTEADVVAAEVPTAEPPTAEPPTAEPPASDAIPFDESLLIKVKGKVVEPTKPDDSERNMNIAKLQAEIQKNSDRIRDIKQLVEEKRGNAKFATQGSQDIMKRMQGFKNEFQSVLRQKQHIRAELQQTTAERDELRNLKRDLQNELRNEARVFTLEAVDTRLREIDSKLNHESLDIQEENYLRTQVKKLTVARPKIIELDAATVKLNENEQIRTEIIDRLKQCDDVLNAIKEKETKERGTLDQIKSRGDDQTSDVPALNVEKQECYDIIVACRDQIQSIREAYNKKYEDFIKADRNYRAWRNWDRKQKYEQRQKERAERNKQREQEHQEQQRGGVDMSFLPEPFDSEIFTCDQAIVFLKKFLASDEVANKQEVKDLGAPAPGMVLFRRKTDDDLESMFTGVGKKKGKKNEKPAEKKPADKKFSHDLDTLKIFMSIGVTAPNSTADVQKTLDAVIAKKEEFKVKQQKVKEDAANGVYHNGNDEAGPSEEAPENGDSAENGDAAKADAEAEVDDAEAEVDAAEAEVDDAEAEVDVAEAEVDDVEAKVDVAEAEVDIPEAKVDVAAAKVNVPEAKVDVPEAKVDAVEAKVDAVEAKVDVAEAKVDVPEAKVDAVEAKVDVAEAKVDVPEAKVDVPEAKVDVVEAKVADAKPAASASEEEVSASPKALTATPAEPVADSAPEEPEAKVEAPKPEENGKPAAEEVKSEPTATATEEAE